MVLFLFVIMVLNLRSQAALERDLIA